MRQLPAAWETLATRKGISASARGIADASGLATTTITRLIFEGRTSHETVRKVADALGVDHSTVYQMAGIQVGKLGPWDPPDAAHQLDGPTRDALNRLILAIVGGEVDEGRQPDAEKTTGPDDGGLTGALAGQDPPPSRSPVTDLSKQREKRTPKPQSKAARRRKTPPETDR